MQADTESFDEKAKWTMIEQSLVGDWHALQERVAQILRECGLKVQTDKEIQTVRGAVNIDVFAEDTSRTPAVTYLCECKHWRTAVPKNVIHGFRTVVADSGANLGLIISSGGFQSGALEAAEYSNVKLLTWQAFQELFADRWYETFMAPLLWQEADPLVEYTEPINSRIFRKADALPSERRNQFKLLREKHFVLGQGLISLWFPFPPLKDGLKPPRLPLRDLLARVPTEDIGQLPDDVLDATTLRALLNALVRSFRQAIAEFDAVFGERA